MDSLENVSKTHQMKDPEGGDRERAKKKKKHKRDLRVYKMLYNLGRHLCSLCYEAVWFPLEVKPVGDLGTKC